MSKQAFWIVPAICMALLSACGGGGATTGTDSPQPQAKRDPIELVVYHPFPQDWSEEDFMKTFGDPMKQKYPHITFKYIAGGKIQDLLTAGQKIDILYTSIGTVAAQLIENQLQYDITPQIKKFNYDLSRLEPTMVDAAKKQAGGNAIYGIPVLVPPSTIYYNKDIFDKFGVAYPKDGMTWDDLYELSKQLTRMDSGTQYYGFASSYGHLAVMNQFSMPMIDPTTRKATFDTNEKWKTFSDNLTRFYKIPGYNLQANQMSEPNERNRFFKDRNIGMFLASTALHSEKELGDMNWDLASFPFYKEMPGVGPQAYPTYFFVTSMSDYKDDAFEAISYLTTDEYQMQKSKEGKFLTVLNKKEIRQAFGQDNPMYKGKNVKALQPDKYAPSGGVDKYNATASGELNTTLKNVNLGTKDINTALREAAEKANKKIEEAEAAAAAAGKK
ncbi:ABC transporter substrate-binding protein [Paenibacillus sp. NPDC056579]|uniref:ABC transporter substrate-binding protein n=1 Tax=Paenibacillus sp. NPDC056579 TaxID=3345871 RepID=UPI00369EB3AC